jgi:LPXTG-motif cell wall-anchored protein
VTEEPQYPPTVPEPNASPSVAPVSPSLAQTGPTGDPVLMAMIGVTALLIGLLLLWLGRNRGRSTS